MTTPKLTLVSHHLCPYAQRAAIALSEQGMSFERRLIDLSNKPDWFTQISPLGKVPLLLIDDDAVLFESSIIAQYVNHISGGGLLADNAIEKYQQLAWQAFASQLIANIGQLYSAHTHSDLGHAQVTLHGQLQRLEQSLHDGPWFAGTQFTLVDAAFAPAFRYFDTLETLTDSAYLEHQPKLAQWRKALSVRPSVIAAVSSDYPQRLRQFLAGRQSVIGRIATTTLASQRAT